MPEGSLIDADGQPTNDPTGFIRDQTGALLSFGRHKGSGLAVMCEIMAAAVGGGQRADQPVQGGILNSMLATVIDLSRLGDPAAIGRGGRGDQGAYPLGARGAGVRRDAAAGRAGAALRPSAAARAGIEVDDTTWRDIWQAAAKLGITEAEIARALGANSGAC